MMDHDIMPTIIQKTRDRQALSASEIRQLVDGVVSGAWPDYQLSAWLMAAYCRGLTDTETFELTGAMADSGGPPQEPLGLVDKHSTGGVGDKTTLVLAPLVASLGLPIAKMSGRGLGHTGGTLDKLESIPGFTVDLSPEAIRAQVRDIGVAVVAQSSTLAPADKRLYALRDVTATVDSIPLIASSIMSKKLASGTRHMVLDVKVGNGAFMTTLERARELARLMVKIGEFHQRHVTALLTTMNEPLGWAIGNAVEVNEAVACLKGGGPEDLRTLVLALAAALEQSVHGTDPDTAYGAARDALASGKAWDVFVRWIAAQGGQPASVEHDLPLAPIVREVHADRQGWVAAIQTQSLGEVALELGAGRHELGDRVDFGVGLQCFAKIGRHFDQGETVAIIYARSEGAAEEAAQGVRAAISWSPQSVAVPPLVLDRIAGA